MKCKCLKCSTLFESEGVHNRLCKFCSEFNSEFGFHLEEYKIVANYKLQTFKDKLVLI